MAGKLPPNTQTIASLAAAGLYLAGICSNGHPARNVEVDMKTLCARLGPDTLVTEAMKHITCAVCGKHVDLRVCSEATRGKHL